MKDLSRDPQASIPKATGHWAPTKGAYRFFAHAQVTAEKILQAHRDAMLERASQEKTILLVQDTTSLHYGLAAEGSQMWARDQACPDIAQLRHQRAIADKESYRWVKSFQASVGLTKSLPQKQIVNIAMWAAEEFLKPKAE